MQFCYIDESGCPGHLPSATSPVQPVFVIVGLVLSASRVPHVTREFLDIKHRFFPGLRGPHFLDGILAEVKGSELRARAALPSRRQYRQALGVLDRVVGLLEDAQARVVGRVYVKGIAEPFDGRAVYTYSVQDICRSYQHMLDVDADEGIVIADSRRKGLNSQVAHSIFTQKYRAAGDPFNRILEMPTFGHSDNHAGLQIVDFVASGLVYPLAVHSYCAGHVRSVHVRPRYDRIKERFAERVNALQYRYQDDRNGRYRGGIVVSDSIGHRAGGLLFR